jgi:hypothetical protein
MDVHLAGAHRTLDTMCFQLRNGGELNERRMRKVRDALDVIRQREGVAACREATARVRRICDERVAELRKSTHRAHRSDAPLRTMRGVGVHPMCGRTVTVVRREPGAVFLAVVH